MTPPDPCRERRAIGLVTASPSGESFEAERASTLLNGMSEGGGEDGAVGRRGEQTNTQLGAGAARGAKVPKELQPIDAAHELLARGHAIIAGAV